MSKRYVVQWRGEGHGYVGKDGWFTSDATKARVWKRRPVVYADEKVIELGPVVPAKGEGGGL